MQLDTITLPDSLVWTNEFASNDQVGQTQDRTLSGALYLQTATQHYGRPITLEGGPDGGWITRATAKALRALEANPDGKYTLTGLPGGHPSQTVVFDRSNGPAFESRMVMRFSDPDDATWYTCTLRLLTVEPI